MAARTSAATKGAVVGGITGAMAAFSYANPVADIPSLFNLFQRMVVGGVIGALGGAFFADRMWGLKGRLTREGHEALAHMVDPLIPSEPILALYEQKKRAYLAKWLTTHRCPDSRGQDAEWATVVDKDGKRLADKAIVEAYVEHARANPEFAVLLSIQIRDEWVERAYQPSVPGVSLSLSEILKQANAALKAKPVNPTFELTDSRGIRTSIKSFMVDKMRGLPADLTGFTMPAEIEINEIIFDLGHKRPSGERLTLLQRLIKEALISAIVTTKGAWDECCAHDSVSIGIEKINNEPVKPILDSILHEMKNPSKDLVVRAGAGAAAPRLRHAIVS